MYVCESNMVHIVAINEDLQKQKYCKQIWVQQSFDIVNRNLLAKQRYSAFESHIFAEEIQISSPR